MTSGSRARKRARDASRADAVCIGDGPDQDHDRHGEENPEKTIHAMQREPIGALPSSG